MAKTSAPSEDETKRELPWERKRSCSCHRSDSVMITLPKCFRQAFNFLIAFAKHESFQYRRVNGRNNSLRHLYTFFLQAEDDDMESTLEPSGSPGDSPPPEGYAAVRQNRLLGKTLQFTSVQSFEENAFAGPGPLVWQC